MKSDITAKGKEKNRNKYKLRHLHFLEGAPRVKS